MGQIIMDHGVSGCFGTSLAPKHCSQLFKNAATNVLGVVTKVGDAHFLLTADLGQDACF